MKISSSEHLVTILIPIYQSTLTYEESLSLRQCMLVLSAYPVKIVKPKSLQLDDICLAYPSIELISFEDAYFKDVEAYNKLMISPAFYESFAMFEYVLIYQLDAYVFRDELKEWCAKGYDYIGAPTLHEEAFDTLTAKDKNDYATALSSKRFVLNGGLSLRRVKSFIRYLRIYNRFYSAWKGNEDMLFSQEATRLIPMKLFMKLPAWQEAIRFAFEKSPAATFELTSHELPFGCHAWERYDPGFWRDYIPVR